ncbi:MAG TPA: hypothetical protein VJX23_02760 [Candidatus Binataceae bacterium]|nr:hypothetical protein [Candidatus Binataceae bacterium]
MIIVDLGGRGILASQFGGIFAGPKRSWAPTRIGSAASTPAIISNKMIFLTFLPETNPEDSSAKKQRES